ncbi:hypothetical protein ACX03_12925 [Vibrio parahaemolyticus]|nr:hypothetical protein ACS91_17175 [Vibrio parahaemolyticus]KOY45246.1 hypothetical protein ACX03_12925 [Vibrio parahaemolyticus]
MPRPYRKKLKAAIESLEMKTSESQIEKLLNMYAAYLYSQGMEDFNPVAILNNQHKLEDHLDTFIGFLYASQPEKKITSIRIEASVLLRCFVQLAKSNNITIPKASLGSAKINDYVQKCIDKYRDLSVNQERLDYLNGWSVTSQSRDKILLNLNFIYVKYGKAFTDDIHEHIKRYALTQKTRTLESRLLELTKLLGVVVKFDAKAKVESFNLLLSAERVQNTFYNAYQVLLAEWIAKNRNLYVSNKKFISAIDVYESVFINTKCYPAPLKPFIKPNVKNVKNPPSFSVGGKASDVEKIVWFADIPLHIKDEQAIDIIEQRVERTMNFLRGTFENHFNELVERHNRNMNFIESGTVKPLSGNAGSQPKSFGEVIAYPIGCENLENTVATFYHYGIKGYTGTQYDLFLGYSGKSAELIKELNLPTSSTLFSLTALLVMEHPKITPSWLAGLQLFNEHGREQCYFQSGADFLLVGDKERRGRALAQQTVILNCFSKSIIDFIIEHTKAAREYLMSIGDTNWKYLLLTATHNQVLRPKLNTNLYKNRSFLSDSLKAYKPEGCKLSDSEIESLSDMTTHRSIRRHRGLQIYLETRSMSAVADALGHKEANNDLLESYLPGPIMKFFTERVVRQFQKAIILQAMKESVYLLDAVNMTYKEIEEFLESHGLKEVPDLNAKAFDTVVSNTKESIFDAVVFTITVPLIQLLMSIKLIIDESVDNDEVSFKDELVEHWYNCASYLLGRFESGYFDSNDDIEEMYQEAKGNPLNPTIIEAAILC